MAQQKVFSPGSWRKMFAGAKCFVRQSGKWSWKIHLGICWVINSIKRAKGIGIAPLERSGKGLWTGDGPQEEPTEQHLQLQLNRQLCLKVTVPKIKSSSKLIAGFGISGNSREFQRLREVCIWASLLTPLTWGRVRLGVLHQRWSGPGTDCPGQWS